MSGTSRILRLLPAVMLTLAACSILPENPPATEPLSSDLIVTGQMDDMMEFYDIVRKQSPAELGQVYEKVKQNFVHNKSDANRARLVLLLILPNTSIRDLNSALHLLNEWPRDAKSTSSLQSFRNLLTSLLVEQQRLQHNVEESTQKLKEEQKRAETLKNQIDALKSMEKNLILREL